MAVLNCRSRLIEILVPEFAAVFWTSKPQCTIANEDARPLVIRDVED